MIDQPPSAKTMFTWLRHMNKYKGSDLFITTNFPPAMKVDGKITPITDEPLTSENVWKSLFRLCPPNKSKSFPPPTNATSPSACPTPVASASMPWCSAARRRWCSAPLPAKSRFRQPQSAARLERRGDEKNAAS